MPSFKLNMFSLSLVYRNAEVRPSRLFAATRNIILFFAFALPTFASASDKPNLLDKAIFEAIGLTPEKIIFQDLDPMSLSQSINYYIWRNFRRSENASGSDPEEIFLARDAQCQGRVLLMGAMLDRLGIQSRMVYLPDIGGGPHSVIEVKNRKGKYVVFDPLAGAFFSTKYPNGTPDLAISDLLSNPKKYMQRGFSPCDKNLANIAGGVPRDIKMPLRLESSHQFCSTHNSSFRLGIVNATFDEKSILEGAWYQAELKDGEWRPLDLVKSQKRACNISTEKSYMKISVPSGDIQSFKVSKSTRDQVIRIQKTGDYPDVLMAGFVPFPSEGSLSLVPDFSGTDIFIFRPTDRVVSI